MYARGGFPQKQSQLLALATSPAATEAPVNRTPTASTSRHMASAATRLPQRSAPSFIPPATPDASSTGPGFRTLNTGQRTRNEEASPSSHHRQG